MPEEFLSKAVVKNLRIKPNDQPPKVEAAPKRVGVNASEDNALAPVTELSREDKSSEPSMANVRTSLNRGVKQDFLSEEPEFKQPKQAPVILDDVKRSQNYLSFSIRNVE